MQIARFLGDIGRFARHRGDAALRSLIAEQQFHRLLERERARSDRTREQFALLVFEAREDRARLATFRRLAIILRGRLRTTDEVGWLDDRRVAALLPCTPTAGAWKVADDVCLRFPDSEFPPLCTVYVYPDDAPSGEAPGHKPDSTPRPVQDMQPLFMKPVPGWKRAIDIAGASVGLVLLAPLMALIALLVKLDSRGPVFFQQRRTGHGGRQFIIHKFRSMATGAESLRNQLLGLNEQDGPAFKLRSDPRVTRMGRFLRATSLDELPQLWNVLCGDMSLVGPRPLPCAESDAMAAWHHRRLDVVPGVTCLWQVKGRCQVAFDDWMRMDLRYIRRQSLPEDLKLLLATIPAVILRKGAH